MQTSRFFLKVAAELYELLLIPYLPGRIGRLIRHWVLKLALKQCGRNVRIDMGVCITGWRNISLGDNVSIMRHSSLYAHDGALRIGSNVSINSNCCIAPANGGSVLIGDNVLIAQNVVIRAADHGHESIDIPIIRQGHRGGEIVIEEDVWIAANAVILRDVTIGAHSIVGAGAVVTRDVEAHSVVGGVPARLIRKRI